MLSIIKERIMADNYIYIDFTNYTVDFKSIYTNFKSFEKKLNLLSEVKVNDKISFDRDNNLYVDYNNSFQPLLRWFYKQNRDTTLNTLAFLMEDYKKLLKLINVSKHHMKDECNELDEIIKEIYIFNRKILIGLNNLKKTYDTDKTYKKLIHDLEHILTNFEKGF